MKRGSGIAALVAAMALVAGAGGACGQSSPSNQPDPAKLDLARRLVELSGGEQQAEMQIKSMMTAIEKAADQSMPAQSESLTRPLYDDMTREMVTLMPKIIDISVRIYAENYTEKELRDLVAFQSSDSGRSMIAKAPVIRSEVMSEILPLVMSAMPQIMRKSFDNVCAQSKCTPQQREAIAGIIARTFPKPQS